jgi:hypothetical protein
MLVGPWLGLIDTIIVAGCKTQTNFVETSTVDQYNPLAAIDGNAGVPSAFLAREKIRGIYAEQNFREGDPDRIANPDVERVAGATWATGSDGGRGC